MWLCASGVAIGVNAFFAIKALGVTVDN